MTILTARGQRMKVVIDGNFIAKKNEKLKIFIKTGVIYIRRLVGTCTIQIQVETV